MREGGSVEHDDPRYVEQALAGDVRARELLAARWLPPAYAIALAHLASPADAEDVAQESVVRALEQLDRCLDRSRVRSWAMAIARNHARKALRWRRLRHPFGAPAEEPRGAAVPELRRDLVHAIEGLSVLRREVLLLHDLEGWTHAEIADHLGLSEVASRQNLFVARRHVRARLGSHDDGHAEAGRDERGR
jgi:RNA polymerase sigma-70 factor (ECF subfamily)